MTALEYHVVDVFTDVPYTGNPLAVVLGAEGLSTAQLQALTREFQLSETAFPLEPDAGQRARGVDYRLRIFNVSAEMPFAGHPSVGTAWLLRSLGRVLPGTVVQACGAGELPLSVPAEGPVELEGGPPHVDGAMDPGVVLAAVGLVPADLADPRVLHVGTGLGYAVAAVYPDALARCAPDLRLLRTLHHPGQDIAPGVYLASWDDGPDSARARMFAGDLATAEDPATGSAALAYGVWLAETGRVPAGGRYTVVQGVEMGRRSVLSGRVEVADGTGRATRVWVAGDAVAVAHGTIAVPPAAGSARSPQG